MNEDFFKLDLSSIYLTEMAELTRWGGIVVKMNPEKDTRHHAIHFHARYSGQQVSVDINGNVLVGTLPSTQLKQVKEWAVLRQSELRKAWEVLSKGGVPDKIEPYE